MARSIEIINEIKDEADALKEQIAALKKSAQDLNRKMLSLPGARGCNMVQSKAIENALDGLALWRRTHLNELAKAFGDKGID
jgi:uncharacterized coiled-coil DUF342 family protein